MINDFFDKYKEMFYNQKFSNDYLKKIEDLSFENQCKFLDYCYNQLFIKEFNQVTSLIESKDKITHKEKETYTKYLNLENKFNRLVYTMQQIVDFNQGINKFFKCFKNIENIQVKIIMSKRTFYRTKKQFIKHLSKLAIDFRKLFSKSKRPISIAYKYTDKQKEEVAKYVQNQLDSKFDNKLNIWVKLYKDNVLEHIGDFSTISYKTMMKFYKEYNNIWFFDRKNVKQKFLLRKYTLNPGHIQMDLKILGVKETGLKKKVTIFNMIDIGTRIAFTKVLRDGTTDNVIKALDEGYDFYSSLGIKIKTMQTDNAMMFKNIQFKLINFVSTNTYSKWLKDRGIHKRNIRLGCPQSNGCIERYHKIIDDEWGYFLKKCETFEDVFNVCKTCSTYYNYSRNHYYHELGQKRYGISYKDRFMIPIQSIKRIQELSTITK